MKKHLLLIIIIILMLPACSVENNLESTDNSNVVDEPVENISEDDILLNPIDINLDNYFNGIDGTAIFLTSENQEYIYNGTLANDRFSPYSTFKIVSTLMGLHEGIIYSKDSTMEYDGSIYWYEPWNDNLNLEQAFQNSCVWYYHQIINEMSQQTVKEHLDLLSYGNTDISQWEGNGSNKKEDLNGFWLGSSLEISPKEHVYLLKTIFEETTIYSNEHILLLQNLMDTGTNNIYAKTGSGSDRSWYVGYFEIDGSAVYFATFIQGENVSGAVAKDLSVSIIKDWHIISAS